MCDAVDKILLQMELTLAIWKSRKDNVRWRRQVFASIGDHAHDLERSEAECAMTTSFAQNRCFSVRLLYQLDLTLAIWGHKQNVR